jgi:hypothetical protein
MGCLEKDDAEEELRDKKSTGDECLFAGSNYKY